MNTPHASTDTIERFVRSEASAEERQGLVRHLLSRCPECLSTAGETPEVRSFQAACGPALPAEAYDQVFATVERQAGKVAQELSAERAQAARLSQSLRDVKMEHRRIRVRNDRRFHSWGLCEHLLAESREAGREHPPRALELAELGVEAARRLDAGRYGAGRVADLCAAAWEAVGNARRWLLDFEGAAEALRCAREELAKGTGDPLIEAVVASAEAALAVETGRFEETRDSLDRAIRVFRRVGDPYLEGRALLLKAVTVGPSDPDRGTALLRKALDCIEKGEPGRGARMVERFAPYLAPWGLQRRSRA